MVRTPGGKERIKAIAHHRHRIRFSFQHRKLRHHCLRFRRLVFSPIRHENRCRADRGIEHFHKPLLGAYVQIMQSREPSCLHIFFFQQFCHSRHRYPLKIIILFFRDVHPHIRFLVRPVRVQKRTFDIDNLFPAPFQYQPGFFRHFRYRQGLQVFLCRIIQKNIHIFRRNHNRHPFLGFGDRQFRAVQPFIFFRHFIQIHNQTICQFSNGNRYAAGAEIIAFLNQSADFPAPEQPLYFTLCRRIPLLHLRAARLNGTFRMYLRRTSRSAASVPSGSAA